MDDRLWIEIGAICVLVLANAFFALAEFSIIASRKSKLQQEIQDRKSGALAAARLHGNPESFLATIQVGITLVGALLGVFSGATLVTRLEQIIRAVPLSGIAEYATPIAFGLVVFVLTILSVVIGELLPKYIALSHPERFARLIAPPITLFLRVTAVFARFLGYLARLIAGLLGVRRDASQNAITEDEINHMIIEGMEKGIFDETEQELIRSAFSFSDSTVRRAMRPRTDVVAIDVNATPEQVQKIIFDSNYSRYPVYERTIDNIVGVLYVKDLISRAIDLNSISLRDFLRKPLFVPESMELSRLLTELKKGSTHLAIILDEFGGTAGIATIEDVLEEIVGEIQDEYDAELPPVVKHSDTIAYVDGAVWPGEINELLGVHLPEETADTIAGLFIEEVGHLPDRYESARIADVKLTILAKDRNRVLRMKIEKVVAGAASAE